eukprot:6183595-Pleurochrysis_carterae.AAC.1
MEVKEADTRTANSITSDRGPSTQGRSDGVMPDSSSEAATRSRCPTRRVTSPITKSLLDLHWRVQ